MGSSKWIVNNLYTCDMNKEEESSESIVNNIDKYINKEGVIEMHCKYRMIPFLLCSYLIFRLCFQWILLIPHVCSNIENV